MGEGGQNGLVRLITSDRLFVVLTSILHRIEHVEISKLICGLTCEVKWGAIYKPRKALRTYGEGGSGGGVKNRLVRLITHDRLIIVLTSILHRIELFEFSRLMYGLTCEVMQVPSYKAQKAQKSYGQGGSGAGVKMAL
jgi:hypothetical protein